MRVSFLVASAALAAGLALSACSGSTGSSSNIPSSGGQVQVMGQSHGHSFVIRLMPGVKPMTVPGCNYSVYAFCFYVTKGNPGPYVETSAGSGYELYNNAYIVKNKSGEIAKRMHTYFYPDPGNPTYQYIKYRGRVPKQPGPVKYTDYYCIGFTPSACSGTTYTFKLGIAIE